MPLVRELTLLFPDAAFKMINRASQLADISFTELVVAASEGRADLIIAEHERVTEVSEFHLRLSSEMLETMHSFLHGSGLSADDFVYLAVQEKLRAQARIRELTSRPPELKVQPVERPR